MGLGTCGSWLAHAIWKCPLHGCVQLVQSTHMCNTFPHWHNTTQGEETTQEASETCRVTQPCTTDNSICWSWFRHIVKLNNRKASKELFSIYRASCVVATNQWQLYQQWHSAELTQGTWSVIQTLNKSISFQDSSDHKAVSDVSACCLTSANNLHHLWTQTISTHTKQNQQPRHGVISIPQNLWQPNTWSQAQANQQSQGRPFWLEMATL